MSLLMFGLSMSALLTLAAYALAFYDDDGFSNA
jgi:hypothetical protein